MIALYLDGPRSTANLPVQLRIGGLIYLAHAALADEGGHVVMGEAGANLQGHEGSVSA